MRTLVIPSVALLPALTVGRIVRVWTDVVATSCPAQGTARHLELLGG